MNENTRFLDLKISLDKQTFQVWITVFDSAKQFYAKKMLQIKPVYIRYSLR